MSKHAENKKYPKYNNFTNTEKNVTLKKKRTERETYRRVNYNCLCVVRQNYGGS
jgi:hypothetical protein